MILGTCRLCRSSLRKYCWILGIEPVALILYPTKTTLGSCPTGDVSQTTFSKSRAKQHCNFVRLDTPSNLVGGAQAIGDNGQTRIDPATRREERRVENVKIVEIVSAVVAVEDSRARIVAEAASAAHVTAVGLPQRDERAQVENRRHGALEALDHHLCSVAQFRRRSIGIDDVLVGAWLRRHVVLKVGKIL